MLTSVILGRFRISRRLILIVWPFLAIVMLLVLLAVGSVDILSSVRAYVGGESLWSKAQKDAVNYLNSYGRTRAPEDYRRLQEAIAVPLGDRIAREELEKSEPDLDAARRGLVVGRNHLNDIDGMIRLFRGFRNVSYIVTDMLIDPIDSAMVEAINRIGHVMGKRTIAEFVENDLILASLRRIGVDYAQGYGIARPQAFRAVGVRRRVGAA